MKSDKIVFESVIKRHEGMDAAFVEFPFSVDELFGTKGQVKIRATFDGCIEYRGSLAKMGYKFHILGITKDIRGKLSKTFGDSIKVELVKDDAERTVEVPADALTLLWDNPEANKYFDSLAFTHRKEYIRWIESAKKDETRKSRLEKFIEKLNRRLKFDEK